MDQNNKVIQLCVDGMYKEASAPAEARLMFIQAWKEAITDCEKSIAAHYVARHQANVSGKLKWDKKAVAFALRSKEKNIGVYLPSLYLNIAKCYEDMHHWQNAMKNFRAALAFAKNLPEDNYGNMIRSGIASGMVRVPPFGKNGETL
jgi:hypothetical protein